MVQKGLKCFLLAIKYARKFSGLEIPVFNFKELKCLFCIFPVLLH